MRKGTNRGAGLKKLREENAKQNRNSARYIELEERFGVTKAPVTSLNRQLASMWLILLGVPIIGLNLVSPHWKTMETMEVCLALLLATGGPLVVFIRAQQRRYFYLSSAAVFWTLLAPFGSWFSIALAERLGISTPLADYQLATLDRIVGLNIPAIHAWALTHRIGIWINETYDWQNWYEVIVVLVPVLSGQVERVLRLNVAFTIALLVALPTALFYPAIGPWYILHIQPDIVQQYIQKSILDFRASGGASFLPIGILVCPSFHTVIALLNGWTLWTNRFLRIPAAIVSGAIVVSTITTGSHYLVDVLTGIGVTVFAVALSGRLEHVARRAGAIKEAKIDVPVSSQPLNS